jgi:glutathione synthase/RimK-type ligase-like ATP-grasp enzyme
VTDVLLATSSAWPDGEPGGELIADALAARGLDARWAVWDDRGVDWSTADVVAVRSTWDYEERLPDFLAWAEHVERWSLLLHGAAAIRWNADKSYLLDLAASGLPVVPTVLLDDPADLAEAAADFRGRVLVKPRVGAHGRGVVVLERGLDLGLPVGLQGARGPWVVQPVVESVRTEGEQSVFVLGGVPVSQVRKVPAGDELRVHEEYGGTTARVELDDEAALVAMQALAVAQELLDGELCYARVDLMRLEDGRLAVGELEAVEPGLYLDVVPENAEAFADVFPPAVERARR